MSEIGRLSNRNRAIQEMMTDGERVKDFYRFAAQNPHISLHDACQIVLVRPKASVCFSFEEWHDMGRRISKGRKGIQYYDSDGNKSFVFDAVEEIIKKCCRALPNTYSKARILPMMNSTIGYSPRA